MFEGGPSPDLASALAEADVATLTDDGVIDAITGWERVSRWAAARSLAAVDELEQRRPGRDAEFVQDEIALALRISRMAAGGRLLLAAQLRRLPGIRDALHAGDLDVIKARIVADAIQPLDDAAASRVEQRVLSRAATQTPGQLRAACERAVLNVDPAAAARRHDHARRDRGIRLIALGDGMAELSLRHTADRITTLYNAIDTLARHARATSDGPGDSSGHSSGDGSVDGDGAIGPDTRTLDQRRADAMADLAQLALDDARLFPTGPTTSAPDADTASQPTDAAPATDPAHVTDPADATDSDDSTDPHDATDPDDVTDPGHAIDPAHATDPPNVTNPAHATDPAHAAAPTGTAPSADSPATAAGVARSAKPDDSPEAFVRSEAFVRPEALVRPEAFVQPPPRRAGRLPGRRRDVLMHVVIPVGTLLGVTDQPGELPGYGPIPADLARRIAADATWQRIFTDPLTGRLTHVDRGAYAPPPSVAEHVRTRDQTCRFPGCRRAARWCDLDHRVPYPHGPTCVCNLCCLCRHHHRLKQHPDWRFEETDDDVYVWTSPTGTRYLSEPPPLLDTPEFLAA